MDPNLAIVPMDRIMRWWLWRRRSIWRKTRTKVLRTINQVSIFRTCRKAAASNARAHPKATLSTWPRATLLSPTAKALTSCEQAESIQSWTVSTTTTFPQASQTTRFSTTGLTRFYVRTRSNPMSSRTLMTQIALDPGKDWDSIRGKNIFCRWFWLIRWVWNRRRGNFIRNKARCRSGRWKRRGKSILWIGSWLIDWLKLNHFIDFIHLIDYVLSYFAFFSRIKMDLIKRNTIKESKKK